MTFKYGGINIVTEGLRVYSDFRSKDFQVNFCFERISHSEFRSNRKLPKKKIHSIETQNAKFVRIESLSIEKIRSKVRIDPISIRPSLGKNAIL